MYSSQSECYRHEQEISLLQDKLMQTHNKLIDQLDICKEQELTIIELTKKMYEIENSNSRTKPTYDNFKYQSFGANNDSFKENYEHNFKGSQDTMSKTDLLQADLQAMRSKVLSEITEKNKIKDELKEIKHIHKKELTAHQKKIEQMENFMKKISQENEDLKVKVQKIRKEKQKQAYQKNEIENLLAKINELEQKYLKQKLNSKEILKERQQIQNKLLQERLKTKQLEKELEKKEKQSNLKQKYSILAESNLATSQQQKEIDALKFQIQKLNKNVQMRDQEFREGLHERKKKRGYQETKELIRKLEQTESSVRKNKKNNA